MELNYLVKLVILIGDFSKYASLSTYNESNWNERGVGDEGGPAYRNDFR